MSWIIPSDLTNEGNRRYREFLEKCKDDAVNKSIPIIDETDSKYFTIVEDALPIPKIIDGDATKKKKRSIKIQNGTNIDPVKYIMAFSKEHEKLSPKPEPIIKKKKKKLLQ